MCHCSGHEHQYGVCRWRASDDERAQWELFSVWLSLSCEAVDRRSSTGYHAARVIGFTTHPHPH